ncbi:MAG: YicC/YloC family endoribonuclease [Rhodospirillaceae bacterium]
MTGFARAEGSTGDCTWVWEAKSVNAKGLDVRCRLANGFDNLEPAVRDRVQTRFRRGNISVGLQLSWTRPSGAYRINSDALDGIRDALPKLKELFPDLAPATLDGLLQLKGVMEAGDEQLDADTREQLDAALLKDLDTALDGLGQARAAEGSHLHEVIGEQLSNIETLRHEAEALAASQPDAIKARLAEQVRELMDAVPALPAERLAQEAALLMLKADVREELDRLGAHCEAARGLLSDGQAVGRRFDFLCQEFNREVNTICSKSADIELTRVGLDLKAMIERMREQVQNVE